MIKAKSANNSNRDARAEYAALICELIRIIEGLSCVKENKAMSKKTVGKKINYNNEARRNSTEQQKNLAAMSVKQEAYNNKSVGAKENAGNRGTKIMSIAPMSNETIKKVNHLPVSDVFLEKIGIEENLNKFISDINSAFEKFLSTSSKPWIKIKGYPVVISTNQEKYLIDFLNQQEMEQVSHYTYHSYSSNEDILYNKRPKEFRFVLPSSTKYYLLSSIFRKIYANQIINLFDSGDYRYMKVDSGSHTLYNSCERLYGIDVRIAKYNYTGNFLASLFQKQLIPDIKGKNVAALISFLEELLKCNIVIIKENNFVINIENGNIEYVKYILSNLKYQSLCENVDRSKVLNNLNEKIRQGNCSSDTIEQIAVDACADLLSYDTERANIKEYDSMMLEDPNRGSWELWDAPYHTGYLLEMPESYYARDPRMDIIDGGVVGIDFGTKSTVVVAQDDSDRIEPMRIGMGRFEKAPSVKDYENPTVMEFIDIDSFLQSYRTNVGRPLTKWADVTASHTAFNDWQENDKSEDYFSFFGELKQWAGDSERRIRIRDKQGKEISLQPYNSLQDTDFDPIELYAYYIGLYINNMHTGRIYLEYLLSFPVTYSLDIRTRILRSFRKGLSRSLPESLRLDSACMEKFSVEQGVGEPAAYAVCALQSYHLRPKDNENVVYGIFDFGGGTTDFDYGIWRKANGPKERRYRYVIEHFGDGGDKYLGGENLLELLAFEVFKSNQDALRKSEITFFKPSECTRFPGSEFLLAESQEAYTNMRQLMEKLRPFWERHKDYEKIYDAGVIKLRLFNRTGDVLNNFELKVEIKALDALLRKRIETGVDAFFDALITNYGKPAYVERLKESNKFHIFLAGNSSKSVILQEIFNKKIAEIPKKIEKKADIQITNTLFEIYPPLGTPEADEKLKKICDTAEIFNDLERPTGKTGVAIGLVQCRKGSKIKVISEVAEEQEIKFRYWIGDADEDEYFTPFISNGFKYNEWMPYVDAGVDRFEFYYTTSTTAGRERGLLVSETKKARQKLPKNAVNEDWMIYLRAVGPNTIEYAVAENEDALKSGNFKYGPIKMDLEE